MEYGSLTLNIPLSVFVKGSSELNDSADAYFSMLGERYPWLSKNSLAVLRRRTEKAMRDVIEENLRGAQKARMMSAEGKHMEAIVHLESYLVEFPDDSDAWYALGDALCGIGRTDDGYKAINHGRRLSNAKKDR